MRTWLLLALLLILALPANARDFERPTSLEITYLDACAAEQISTAAVLGQPGLSQSPGLLLNQVWVFRDLMIDGFVFSPDCIYAAVIIPENDIKIVELESLTDVTSLPGTKNLEVGRVAWLGNSEDLCTIGLIEIVCWRAKTGTAFWVINLESGYRKFIQTISVSGWLFSITAWDGVDENDIVMGSQAISLETGAVVYAMYPNIGQLSGIDVLPLENGDFQIAVVSVEGRGALDYLDIDAPISPEIRQEIRMEVFAIEDGDNNLPSISWVNRNQLAIASTLMVVSDDESIIMFPPVGNFYATFDLFRPAEEADI